MSTMEKISFAFSDANLQKAKEILKQYPKGKEQSAILPLLDMAQRQHDNWLPVYVIEYVANFLDIPFMRAYEIASFYTMFNLKPVGKYHIQVCGTTPCWLRGADKIIDTCKSKLGISKGQTSEDGLFTLTEVECLGACRNAPVAQINDDYFEDLDEKKMDELIRKMADGKQLTKPKGKKNG